MALNKFLFTAMVLSVYGTAVHAVPCRFWCRCRSPFEGRWQVTNNFPDKNGKLELHIVTEINLKNAFGNVYNGTGISNQFIPEKRADIPVSFVAQFDPSSCVLSGAVYAPSIKASSTFFWKSFGDRMEGPYTVVFDGKLAIPATGIHEATFIGYDD